MKMKGKYALGLAVLAAVFAGCDRGQSLSEIEARERTTRLYANAADDLQAGRVEAAIKGFERVVLQEPKSYSAHFQLATLLQDVRKDYIAAIAHYRNYLALRPAAEKATVATDRMKLCERLLMAEIVRKVGGSASEQLKKDNQTLMAQCQELTEKLKRLEADLATTNRVLARVAAENEMKKNLLEKLTAEDTRAAPATAAAALAELKKMEQEDARRRLQPTDAELLDEDTPPPATPVDDRIRNSADVKRLRQQLAQEEDRDIARPAARAAPRSPQVASLLGGRKKPSSASAARPSTYTVQDGDTLYKISERFYGSSHMWRRIREANKAKISSDGRIRAGQVLVLP